MADEAAFLTAVRAAPTDDMVRMVYADWLDERGLPGGGYLRAECELAALAPSDPRRDRVRDQLREVGAGVDPGWLAAVSRAPVENCGVEFRFRCPLRWEYLRPTGEEGVRFCDGCRRQVFFCGSIAVARDFAAIGECIAVDPRLIRRPRDLESSMWNLDGGPHMGMASPGEETDPKGEAPPPPAGGRRR